CFQATAAATAAAAAARNGRLHIGRHLQRSLQPSWPQASVASSNESIDENAAEAGDGSISASPPECRICRCSAEELRERAISDRLYRVKCACAGSLGSLCGNCYRMFYLERQLDRCELCQQQIGINDASTLLRLRRWWQQCKQSMPFLNFRPPSSTCRAGVFLCSVLFVLFLLGVLVGFTMQIGHEHCRCRWLTQNQTSLVYPLTTPETAVLNSSNSQKSSTASSSSAAAGYEPLFHGPVLPVLSAMCAMLLLLVAYSLRRCLTLRVRRMQQRADIEAAIGGDLGD
uniref:RING-CH-type domain-containing protein n=1 Tax=Macrostomum lignano TaxID=282301 RepID=A0A1I8H642_9PLAT